ncbi:MULTISPECIES: SRPBCC family protein [Microbacterium]|uniref:Uncharacterized conserved protein YndB, AHSA1/START domain n=1 Tax=Microbacterium saccharophilum TaxID=1213358 RepID=A0A7Z7D058_9MICO|nr:MULTISPECIES: SRPBCC family protein [Microbacterium]SFI34331.1 Uncharacterized conserved protein YndB, AHSA1/START domain [Microbacterium saccharophilum]
MIEEFTRSLTGRAGQPVLRWERRYMAPPSELWSALTEPERLRRWLGEVTGERAAGYRIRFADAPDAPAHARIEECSPPSRLCVAWEWQGERASRVVVDLAPDADGTRLTLTHSLNEPDHLPDYGGGWERCFATLAAQFGGAVPADDEPARAARWGDMQRRAVDVALDLPVPPEQVWTAFATAEGLRSWWWTHWDDVEIAADPRPGGAYRIAAPAAGILLEGRYLELEAPTHLAFTWQWTDADGTSRDEACDVAITATDGGSRLTVRHTGPWSDEAPAESYRQGWEFTLGQLRRTLSG